MIIHNTNYNNNLPADNPGSLFVSHPLVFNPCTHDCFPLAHDYRTVIMVIHHHVHNLGPMVASHYPVLIQVQCLFLNPL